MRSSGTLCKHSALLGHKDDLVKHEQRTTYRQIVDAKDTSKFLEELARQIKKLVANFMVRVTHTLPPLSLHD
jgi:hypothetical protein